MLSKHAELVLLSSGELIYHGQSSNRIQIAGNVTTIGRDNHRADIAVQNVELGGESYISGIHCTIFYEVPEDRYYIIDNNSTNGTLLNGKALPAGTATLLNDADVIELSMIRRGGAIIRFYTNPPAEHDIRRTEPVMQAVSEPDWERDPVTKPVGTGQLNPDVLTSPHSVFISYSHEDAKMMRQIVGDLRDNYYLKHVDFWTDESLKVGTPSWNRKVEEAIENAHAFIAILTPHAKRSEWVERELNYAQAQRLRVFPVLAHDNEIASVPLMLINLQRADIIRDYQMGMQRLMNDIHDHLKRLEDD